jgi:pyrimidine 5'-nucleotidase
VQKILLLDYDHTLYPSTLNTLKAVDERINLYIRTFLGFSPAEADAARLNLWSQYGTTLKGLEENHGVNRDHYTDFIHAIDEEHLPPPDLELSAWLSRISIPTYIFTNARMDWPVRGLKAMGLGSLLPQECIQVNWVEPQGSNVSNSGMALLNGLRLEGIFDIAFMDWQGKPHPDSYAKVEAHLRQKHGNKIQIYFADDRIDNLETARSRAWYTIWIAPHDAPDMPVGSFDQVVSSLSSFDLDQLV